MGNEARDLFDAGFAACWATMFVASNETPAFMLTDDVFDRAWEIYLATRETPAVARANKDNDHEQG